MSSFSGQFSNSKKPSIDLDNRTIVFISSHLANWDFLVQKVIPEARGIVIGSQADGIKEITEILSLSQCREIHLVSYGSPGCFYLGNSELSLNTLIRYTPELRSWFNIGFPVQNPNKKLPRISLYGCNVAAGDVGEEFINKLNRITGAEITASVNITNSNVLSYCG
ncbi:DUF4347 domain-containing protein [Pleurocapsales cyanobacterium LEGE 10410]|nr:DUF4347 domain-containing protein [Pleurocapsales cyanobacterium LEGE 10410]